MDYLQQILNEVTIMPPSLGALIAILIAGILLIFSGFASGSEIAFFSLSPTDLSELDEDKNDSDRKIRELREAAAKGYLQSASRQAGDGIYDALGDDAAAGDAEKGRRVQALGQGVQGFVHHVRGPGSGDDEGVLGLGVEIGDV